MGTDTLIPTKLNKSKNIYTIRFHLTPICSCLLTNNKTSVLIKTKENNSFIFTAEANLTLDESIYISNGKRIEKTKQIVISGHASSTKKQINWLFEKID